MTATQSNGVKVKKGVGAYVDALAVVLAIVGAFVTIACGTMNSDYGLGSLPMYVAGIVASVVLVVLAEWNDCRPGHNELVTMICLGVAIFLLAYVAIQVIGARIILISGLFSWNASNTPGWNVFYVTVAAAALLLISALLLTVGSFLPISKKAQKRS